MTTLVVYCVDLAVVTRQHPALEVGASLRGSQNLVLLARVVAALEGRDFVTALRPPTRSDR